MRYYDKFFEVLVKSPITLLSSPRFSASDQLPPHALSALPSTWSGCEYLRGGNQGVVVRGGVPIASGPTYSVASYRQFLTPATLRTNIFARRERHPYRVELPPSFSASMRTRNYQTLHQVQP